MKHILIALLTLCLPLAGAEKRKTDVETAGCKGRVKSVKKSVSKIVEKFGELQRFGGVVLRKINLYDKDGNEVERTHFHGGEISAKYKYKHQEKLNRVETLGFDANGKPKSMQISKYDEQGDEVEIQDLDINGKLINKHTFRYDVKGNQLEQKSFDFEDSNGRCFGSSTFKYDKKGNRVEWVFKGDAFSDRTTYKYDDKGNLVEEVEFDDKGKLNFKRTYKYGVRGNKTMGIKYELKKAFGEARFVPTEEITWTYTYWD